MRKTPSFFKFSLSFVFLFFFALSANGQILKKLGKKAEKAAERTLERRVEKESEKKTDEVLDSIFEPGKKGKQKPSIPNEKNPNQDSKKNPTAENENPNGASKGIKIYSKFDFVPGDKLLFFDDFSNDFIGDFPAKWNTNGSGEVITVDNLPQRWLQMIAGYGTYYIPDLSELPEEYTIEFDILVDGIDNKTSSTATLEVTLSDQNTFKGGESYVQVNLPLCQYTAVGVRINSKIKGAGDNAKINNTVKADIRAVVVNKPHISIAVNKLRYRLWVNEKKYLDVPRAVAPNQQLKALKFKTNGIKDGKESVFISNIKVAEGGLDLRRKLLSEGKVSTNGILFDSGSANIQPQSMGIIRQISQVLQQDATINLKVVGHTDTDGPDDVNMSLSKKRAESVMNALISVYNVSPERLSAAGMGETQPVGDNKTTDGKAKNRRVEFIKE